MILFGYAKTTSAIAKRFGGCKIYDDKFSEKSAYESNFLLPMSDFTQEKGEPAIPSPGFPPSHPVLRKAQNVMSEYDLFAGTMPFSIWISGTNGKTTTTEILDFLLKKRGSVSGGNIGTPLAELDERANIWVLETSSFTLHYTQKATPNVYVLLPITPDHISWHGSFEAYEQAKLKPLSAMQEGELAILPQKYAASAQTKAFVVGYENEQDLAREFGLDLARIALKPPFLLDAVLALCVTKALFNETPYDLLSGYKLDPHKMEEFYDARGRMWVNDSKATNIDAVLAALKTYGVHEIHLILGGDDKGVSLDELFDFLRGKNVEIYAIGSNAVKVVEGCAARGVAAHLCGFLDVAVAKIDANFTQGVALLSPAAASLDQFKSYAHRGDSFKALVSELK